MIEKNRLEELIKEGATIYTNRFKKPDKYKLYKEYFVAKDELVACNKSQTAIDCVIELSKLFETREEAEWALKYQRIPRTEYLDLPTWEEFKKVRYYEFFNGRFDYMLQYQALSNKICLCERNNFGDYFCEPPTEENYIKACDLCVKLFKGE